MATKAIRMGWQVEASEGVIRDAHRRLRFFERSGQGETKAARRLRDLINAHMATVAQINRASN
jgi:hypothetical protein